MGFALFAAFPRRSTVLWGATVIALSFAIWPAWVSEWLLVRDRRQAAVYATLTMIAHVLFKLGLQGPRPTGAEYQWWVMLLLVYLPALVLVLKRPNGPATLDWPYPAAGPSA